MTSETIYNIVDIVVFISLFSIILAAIFDRKIHNKFYEQRTKLFDSIKNAPNLEKNDLTCEILHKGWLHKLCISLYINPNRIYSKRLRKYL